MTRRTLQRLSRPRSRQLVRFAAYGFSPHGFPRATGLGDEGQRGCGIPTHRRAARRLSTAGDTVTIESGQDFGRERHTSGTDARVDAIRDVVR